MQNTRAKNYTDWYQEVITGADMAENSPVRGCMVIKPWGMGIWERIKFLLDEKIRETGHENCYFPLFVPLSFFMKEAEHVDGFAKEMAMVTHTRLKIVDGEAKLEGKLEEPLVIRPTSETIIADAFSRWIQSYRDLPVLVNQWANVVRWELRPRMFLRTTEFLWQEGHTAHANEKEAREEAMTMLEVYRNLAEGSLALPVITGDKPDHEKFPGAVNTFTFEAMMQDGKALQAGTSHYLGQGFAKAANIEFQDKDGKLQHVHTTSWGVTTRLVGAIIMTHADDDGLRLPPAIAPYQVIILPLIREDADREPVTAYAEKLKAELLSKQALNEKIRVKIDHRDRKNQDKRWDWIKKGAPLIIEVGPRDLEKKGVAVVTRTDIKKKDFPSFDDFVAGVSDRLEGMQKELFEQAKTYRDNNYRVDIKDLEGLKKHFEKKSEFLEKGGPGFVKAKWCGEIESLAVLDELSVTIRCIPFEQSGIVGKCVVTGKDATTDVILARAY